MSRAPKLCGIYAIRKDERFYIGHSSNIRIRWSKHKYLLRKGAHPNPHLQNAWNLYGEEAFEFLVLEECAVELLLEREQYYFDQHLDKYNIALVAGSRLGVPQSPETKARIGAASKGHEVSPEAREKMRVALTGRVISEETRAKMSAAQKGNTKRRGHVDTPEARANMSAGQMGNTNNLGHVASPEARANMSMAQTGNKNCVGRVMSSATRERIAASHRGKPKPSLIGNKNAAGAVKSPETREKLSAANRGRTHTPEARANMSAAAKARWARQRSTDAGAIDTTTDSDLTSSV